MTLVEEWLAWLQVERGRSANTVNTYARTMRALAVFRDPTDDSEHPRMIHLDPVTATRQDIELWWKSRAKDEDGNARPHSSRNNELSAVRAFYKWAVRFEHRTDDPTIRLDQLKQQRRESRFIGREDLDRLLAELKPDLRRAVALGAYGGLRVSEAAFLSWEDINIETRRMIVRGKGDKERPVGLPTLLLDILLPAKPGMNVVTGKAVGYDGHYLQMKINKAMHDAGVTESFHKLRHRFGYMAAAKGAKPTAIAKAMGHENLSTTMRYVAAMDSDLDFIAEAVTA